MMTVYLVHESADGHAAVVCEECGKRPLLARHYRARLSEFEGLPPYYCFHVWQEYQAGARQFDLKVPEFDDNGDLK